MPFAEHAHEFYGKPICDLTYNQLKLLIYSRYFRNIFNNNDKMPDHIKKDIDFHFAKDMMDVIKIAVPGLNLKTPIKKTTAKTKK